MCVWEDDRLARCRSSLLGHVSRARRFLSSGGLCPRDIITALSLCGVPVVVPDERQTFRVDTGLVVVPERKGLVGERLRPPQSLTTPVPHSVPSHHALRLTLPLPPYSGTYDLS